VSLFLRITRHLLPKAAAWLIREGGTRPIERFFEGLSGTPASARGFADEAYLDLFPETTREPDEHLQEFAIRSNGGLATKRELLTSAWRATGGQSPHYFQSRLQEAGFPLYVHDWWASGPPYVERDPRTYTAQPLIGTVQCGEASAQCGEPQALCNGFLQNNPSYLINETLSRRPPSPISSNAKKWRHFIYLGAESFPALAAVPAARRLELEQLVLQLKPAEKWIVMLVDYTPDPGLLINLDFEVADNSHWFPQV
jgi:hypothetical protein